MYLKNFFSGVRVILLYDPQPKHQYEWEPILLIVIESVCTIVVVVVFDYLIIEIIYFYHKTEYDALRA